MHNLVPFSRRLLRHSFGCFLSVPFHCGVGLRTVALTEELLASTTGLCCVLPYGDEKASASLRCVSNSKAAGTMCQIHPNPVLLVSKES